MLFGLQKAVCSANQNFKLFLVFRLIIATSRVVGSLHDRQYTLLSTGFAFGFAVSFTVIFTVSFTISHQMLGTNSAAVCIANSTMTHGLEGIFMIFFIILLHAVVPVESTLWIPQTAKQTPWTSAFQRRTHFKNKFKMTCN